MAFANQEHYEVRGQFQGFYSHMWQVSGTKNFGSIAAGGEGSDFLTVPGIALGDQVLSWGVDLNPNNSLFWTVNVQSADTLWIVITNVHASNAVDLANLTFKALIGRPSW